ncbi:hypothetical protein HELRODRAFT_180350 [Helobdella robusta]|uniref:Uncharacterized protein n=1 Tax=Helobdella robusta TaxID=6412 RepID=T1FFS9_HELRO|nr:hypothetical protein HELRODRAFT_180350 [Helobdella robusta]ESN93941.1 hypothetical protein HELRODRAFT_180350 [Helobdella robusta]
MDHKMMRHKKCSKSDLENWSKLVKIDLGVLIQRYLLNRYNPCMLRYFMSILHSDKLLFQEQKNHESQRSDLDFQKSFLVQIFFWGSLFAPLYVFPENVAQL